MIDKIAEGICESDWAALHQHYLRNSLILVDQSLDLVDVGLKIANDETEIVQLWLEKTLLGKPTAVQVEAWEQNDHKRFQFVIVQPYVLAQLLEH